MKFIVRQCGWEQKWSDAFTQDVGMGSGNRGHEKLLKGLSERTATTIPDASSATATLYTARDRYQTCAVREASPGPQRGQLKFRCSVSRAKYPGIAQRGRPCNAPSATTRDTLCRPMFPQFLSSSRWPSKLTHEFAHGKHIAVFTRAHLIRRRLRRIRGNQK